MCPHTAVAQLGADNYKKVVDKNVVTVVLSTAHYAKFLDVVEDTLGTKVDVPERLSALLSKEKVAIPMSKEFIDFKKYLLY